MCGHLQMWFVNKVEGAKTKTLAMAHTFGYVLDIKKSYNPLG